MNNTEKYFRALGWFQGCATPDPESAYVWVQPPNQIYGEELPNITESMSAFNKWVAERMEKYGYKYRIHVGQWIWGFSASLLFDEHDKGEFKEPIKDNEILEAAVIAATRYLEGKK